MAMITRRKKIQRLLWNIFVHQQVEGILDEFTPDLMRWEDHQKKLGAESLKHMKDDFINRPDLFLSNMLFLSPQFYENFEKWVPWSMLGPL